jgi:large subunit ribosomal protein L18
MKSTNFTKKFKKQRRQAKVRAKISGTAERPRLNVNRSNRSLFVQVIDDTKGITLACAHTRELAKDKSKKAKMTGVEAGFELGKIIARKAGDKNIKSVVFDRAGYNYHGRVKAVAQGAREGGLEF